MVEKQTPRPTDAELAILNVLWERGPSTVRDVHDTLSAIQATGSADSAAIIRDVLNGVDSPALRIVLANAAAALWAAESVRTLREGVERAEAALTSGKAKAVLEQLAKG